ncbi:MAG: hypothetical protein AAF570_03900 [Bacteroidota bacterium]
MAYYEMSVLQTGLNPVSLGTWTIGKRVHPLHSFSGEAKNLGKTLTGKFKYAHGEAYTFTGSLEGVNKYVVDVQRFSQNIGETWQFGTLKDRIMAINLTADHSKSGQGLTGTITLIYDQEGNTKQYNVSGKYVDALAPS